MTLKDWNIFLSHISDLSDWLPFIVWLFLPRSRRNELNNLGAYLLVNSLLKTTTLILLSVNRHFNTMLFYHLMAAAELVFLSLYLTSLLRINQPARWCLIFSFFVD